MEKGRRLPKEGGGNIGKASENGKWGGREMSVYADGGSAQWGGRLMGWKERPPWDGRNDPCTI